MKNNIYPRLKSVLLPLFIWLLMAMSLSGMAQTIITDKADYLPGDQVIINGSGWLSGEAINLTIEHLVFTNHPDEFLNTTADESGNLTNTDYIIDPWDLGETFKLTATGQRSGSVASVEFTDAEGSFSKPYAHWSDEPLPGDWNNNILNDNKSNYFEDEVIPHVFMYGASNNAQLVNGQSYSFNVTYNWYQDNTDAGGFAYMTQYNLSRQPSAFDWATPVTTPVADNSFTNGGGMASGANFYTVDANITNITAVTYTGTGTKDGHVTITFTYTGTTTSNGYAAIYYGLYIAKPGQVPDQGKGKTNGANAWSGGSLQTTVDIGGSGASSIQLAPSAIIPGEISGLKFSDLNNNGTKDTGEPGLASWTICLDSDNNPSNGNLGCVQTSNGTTDDQDGDGIVDPVGFFYFSVTPGTYYVFEVNQTGWTMTMPSNGYYGPLVISATTTSYINQNFGNYFCLPPDLSNASLTLCAATPGGTTATFDLTTANTGVNTTTMTVVYSNGSGTISTPSAYSASNGATVTVTAYFKDQSATCTDVATITLHVQPVPDLNDASLTKCAASPAGTTATFDLTTAATGVNATTMTVVYSNGTTPITDPSTYQAANNATVTVTAYFKTSAATCTDVATITLHVQPVPDLADASLTLCAAAPGGTTATFNLTSAATGVNTTTMTVVYSNINGIIANPSAYLASEGATVTVTAYFKTSAATCTDVATITLHVQPVPDLADVSLTLCAAAPGGTTATFNLTSAATGVNTTTMNVVYSVGGVAIADPSAYQASNGATVNVTAYFKTSAATCTDVATITLHVQPVPDLNDASLTKCATDPGGTTAIFDLTKALTGADASSMTIVYRNGNTIIDTPAAYQAANNATVTVTAYFNTSAATCTDVATITLHVQPVPDLNDASLALCADGNGGTTATFDLTKALTGADASSMTIIYRNGNTIIDTPAAYQAANNATVTVTAYFNTSAATCTASSNITLTVNPAITVSVADQAVCYGEDVIFTAIAGGGTGTGYVFEWKVGDAVQASVTGSTLTLNDVIANATISVKVTDNFTPTSGPACTANDAATLTVNPAISVSVDDKAVCYGQNVTFTANASGGTGNYTFVWSVDGDPQPATSSNTLDLENVTADANISVSVNDDFFTNNILLKSAIISCIATDNAVLDVNPAISVTVDNQAVCYGEDVTFTANASGGTGNYTFVWSVGGVSQDPTSSNTLDLLNVTADANISVTVNDDFVPTFGATTCSASDEASLTVNPAISVTVNNQAVCYSEDVTFTAIAGGGTGTGYVFEWKVGDAVQSSVTGSTLTLNDVIANATISVKVTDNFIPTSGPACTANDAATLTVNPAISVSVDDKAVCYGQNVTFTANASGGTGTGYVFEWKVGNIIQTSVTGSTLTLNAVTASASISVSVKDNFVPTAGATTCTATDGANLTVNPAISVSVADQTVCYGENVTFTANASGGTGHFSYMWLFNGMLQTSNTSTLTLNNVTANATISVTVNDDFVPTAGAIMRPVSLCNANDAATLTVNPAISVSVDDKAVCYGQNVTFTANASGGTGSGYVFEWKVGNIIQTSVTGSILTLNAVTASASISVSVKDNLVPTAGATTCTATDGANLTVNPAISVSVADQTVCYGENVTFTANASGGTGNYSFVWSVGGVPQDPTSSNTLDLLNVTADANISVTVNDDFVPTFGATTCSASDDASLTVNPAISVTVNNQAVCYGEDVTFTANASGGTGNFTFLWSVGGVSQDPTSSNTLDLLNVTADANISVTVNDDFVPTFGAKACTATDDAALDVSGQIIVSISADPNCELGKAGLPSGIITVKGSGYETLQLWSAGADEAIGGGDDALIASVTTSTSPYDFEKVNSGSYYVIALVPHPSGTGTCDATSNVAIVDECYWFNIAKVTQGVVDPTKDWRFTLYVGPDGFGKTSVGSGSTLNDADGILTFGNVNLDPTKTYTICEEQMAAGWSAIWVTDIKGVQTVLMTYNPNGDETPPQDLGNRCFDIGAGTAYPLYPNDIFTINVDNTYPGGTARTPGYWKNWASCTGGGQEANAARNGGWQAGYWILDDVLNSPGVTLGAYKVASCQIGVKILDQRDISSGKKSASDPIYTLAMHLMAFKCNQAAGAYGCPYAIDAAAKADLLLISVGYNAQGSYTKKLTKTNSSYALSLAKILDEYNNNRLSATDCAKTVKSAELAEIGVPATTFESTFRAYPNPFTEKLNIEFSSATDTQVRLEIYSITGARMEVLFNGPVNAGELYTVEYLPKLVSSQIVFYHLTINGNTQVGKLIYNERR